MLRLRHGLDSRGQFRQHRDVYRNRGLVAPERNDPALNVLQAEPHHIDAGRHSPIEQFKREPRASAERMARAVLLDRGERPRLETAGILRLAELHGLGRIDIDKLVSQAERREPAQRLEPIALCPWFKPREQPLHMLSLELADALVAVVLPKPF